MNKKDVTTKLAATEASLKRWQSRLKRAATKVTELDKARRRYQLLLLKVKVEKQIEATPPGSLAEKYKQDEAALINAAIELDIPDFLDRSDPLIAEKMTAARKKAEAEERRKMPLAGKAASDYIKAPRKRKD